tara:strand:+ start:1129 stop:1482 length:354 start_codon:yes stop_codon:yes gene_type:complete
MKNIDVDSEVQNIMLNKDYKHKFHKILELMGKIFDNRDSQYGDFKDNSQQIARLRSIVHNVRVRPEDVCIDHILDKINRIVRGQKKADNYLDGANYFILMLLVVFENKAEKGTYDYH